MFCNYKGECDCNRRLLLTLFISIVSITANYVTGFKTILLPGLILAFYLLFQQPISFKFLDTIKYYRKYVLFTVISIVLLNLKYLNSKLTFDMVAWGDKSFYAQVSGFINETGIETYYFDYINAATRKPIPYHYGENWFTIFFSRIFSLNEFYAQELIANPILLGTSLFCVNNIYMRSGYSLLHSLTFSLSTIFFTGVPFINYDSIPILGDMINQFRLNPISFNKFIFSIALLSFFFDSLSANNWKISGSSVIISLFSFLCCISFFNILLISLILFVVNKNVSIKDKLLIVTIVLASILYFVNFYFNNNSLNESSNYSATDFSFFNSCISPLIYFKTLLNIFGKSLIQLVIVFLPIVAYLIVNIKRIYTSQIHLFNLTIFIILSGLGLWATMWFSIGSISLFSDASFWAFKLCLFFILFLDIKNYYFSNNSNLLNRLTILIAVILLPSIYNIIFQRKSNEGREFIEFAKGINLEKNNPITYLRVYDPNKTFHSKNLLASTSYGPVSNFTTKHQGIFVDINNITYSGDCLTAYREKPLISTACFVNYCKLNKFDNQNIALITLIKDYKVKYIFKDKDYFGPSITSGLPTKKIFENNTIEVLEIL